MYKHLYQYEGKTYRRTRKDVAEREILKGKSFFLVGSNVNSLHFHGGWHLATIPTNIDRLNDPLHGILYEPVVQTYYRNFSFFLEPELGRYPVFYIEI